MTAPADRPVTLLIAALGVEGGGVLSGWVVRAAEGAGLIAQSTSIPGVAQRTGATTYYLEIFPTPVSDLGGRRPVLSLFPSVGDVDVMVASEIIEAGRTIQAGYVTPNRTTLIASTHRIFAIAERSAMADERFDLGRIAEAAAQQSRRPMLADFTAIAARHGTVLNAVLLGVLAGAAILPIPVDAYRDAIRADGRAVESNLAGFDAGFALADADAIPLFQQAPPETKRPRRPTRAALEARVASEYTNSTGAVVGEGVRRLVDYQGPRYAARYLDRLSGLRDAAPDGDAAIGETARLLALWMSYEDVIRVAQIKTQPDRYRRALEDVRATAGEPVRITEFFKPGIDELCAVLPFFFARPILRISERRGWHDRFHVGLHIRTTSISGFLMVWMLAQMRPLRPRTWRFRDEQARIDRWLTDIQIALTVDAGLALEIAACAELLKGYGDTLRRGRQNFERIRSALVEPALSGAMPPQRAADALANARAAALADVSGGRLEAVLESIGKVEVPDLDPITRAAE